MAKVSFTKLGLAKSVEPKSIIWNEQEIEIKQYLPVNEKLELISNVINLSADDNNFANPIKVDIFTSLEILYHYTNINFTEKQREDPAKLYDLVILNGLMAEVAKNIPITEYKGIFDAVKRCVEAVYTYRNSLLGILENVAQDYSNLEMDVSDLQSRIGAPENMAFLKEVITKLG